MISKTNIKKEIYFRIDELASHNGYRDYRDVIDSTLGDILPAQEKEEALLIKECSDKLWNTFYILTEPDEFFIQEEIKLTQELIDKLNKEV
jgi:hypothetical protein